MADLTPIRAARKLLATLDKDRDERLVRLRDYLHGEQASPYMPDNADAEYRLLAERAITNVMDFIVKTPVQALYVDSFRRGRSSGESQVSSFQRGSTRTILPEQRVQAVQPEWDTWQRSGMDARQHPVYEAAMAYGHSFVLAERDEKRGEVVYRGLSALKTSALFRDPANDVNPTHALHVTKWPGKDDKENGEALLWDERYTYKVAFKSFSDLKEGVTCTRLKLHGGDGENPVTRFAPNVDLDGRTWGVVEPMIPLQDRINQTVFDMLVAQTYNSFEVRTISGMAPPVVKVPVDEDGNKIENPNDPAQQARIAGFVDKIDPESGRPVVSDLNLNARRWLVANDPDTKFGSLKGTPLDGFIKAIEMGFRQMAALSQTPPHHILGEIANLSAEALVAAETALDRKVEQFKSSFGESWERVFRIGAKLSGDSVGAEDFNGEVMWRDMGQKSLAQSADALGKLSDQLGIPKRGLWGRVPGVTAIEIAHWEELREEEDADLAIASAVNRASSRPSIRGVPSEDEEAS